MLNEPQFSEYGGTGSVKDFFSENSNGQFVPHFDLYGPVTLSQNRSYYGGNNWAGNDENPEDMIIEACRQLDDQIDFSIYDNDGDGVVDNVYVFYAGQGEASGGPDESVWPHSWELSSAHKDLKLDGVTIDRYACSNEWEGSRPDGIGTFTHEFSHVMGLPDLYTTNYNSYMTLTPGSWSVMDYGPYNNEGRTPPAYSIYERNALKWLQPRVIDGPISITLEDIKSSNDGCIVTTSKQNEFFLFENRQQTGWDTYVPGHGMLIWHIDFDQDVFDANTVNNQSHQYVDIVEACNKANNENEALMAAYPWPGTQSKTSFTADTKPAFKSYAGADLKLPITDIKETDGVITFNVDGGTPVPPPIETPTALEPADVGEDYAVVTWTPVEGATDYALYLYQQGAGEAATHTANMGAGNSFSLPEGWSSSATTIYTTSGNYGEASPSYKLSSDGAWLETPDFGADVKKVEFWTRAQNSSGGSELDLLGYKDGQWITLRQIIPSSAMAETSYNINDIPEGVTAIKFVYKKVRGNYALDDVVVTLGPSNKLLRTVESTGGETSFKFEGLDYASYLFEVTATDGEYVTPRSNRVTFVTKPSSVEMNVSTAAGEVKYFDLLGRRITAPAPGTICIEKRGATARRIIKR